MYSSVKKWVNSWYRKQEILSIRCSSYRLCAIWEFRGGQPIRWLSLSALSGSKWNLEYSTWFLWREENMRTCRKNFWARTIKPIEATVVGLVNTLTNALAPNECCCLSQEHFYLRISKHIFLLPNNTTMTLNKWIPFSVFPICKQPKHP